MSSLTVNSYIRLFIPEEKNKYSLWKCKVLVLYSHILYKWKLILYCLQNKMINFQKYIYLKIWTYLFWGYTRQTGTLSVAAVLRLVSITCNFLKKREKKVLRWLQSCHIKGGNYTLLYWFPNYFNTIFIFILNIMDGHLKSLGSSSLCLFLTTLSLFNVNNERPNSNIQGTIAYNKTRRHFPLLRHQNCQRLCQRCCRLASSATR